MSSSSISSKVFPKAKGLDLLEAMPHREARFRHPRTNDYADTANSNIVVITAGIPRKPGMSRDDLLNTNYKIMKRRSRQGCAALAELHPHHRLQPARRHGTGRLQAQQLPREACHRHAAILDSARFRASSRRS